MHFLFTDTTLQAADPVRILLDITTQNLTLLNSEERAKCIDMMLGNFHNYILINSFTFVPMAKTLIIIIHYVHREQYI